MLIQLLLTAPAASEDWISMGRLSYALRLASLKEKAKTERNKNIYITTS